MKIFLRACKQMLNSMGRWPRLAVMGFFLLALAAVVLTNSIMSSYEQMRKEAISTTNVLRALETLRSNLARAETAQSTYLLTQRKEYISPFQRNISRVRENLVLISQKYNQKNQENKQSDGLGSQADALWTAVQTDVEAKITVMQYAVSMLANGRDEQAVEIINAGDGIQKMEDFYQHSESLLALEAQRLEALRSQSAIFLILGRASGAAGVLVALMLMLILVKIFVQEIARREDSKAELQQAVIEVEKKLEERTRLLETLARDYQFDVERERHKLSRELHDELGSILTASKMDMSWVIRKIKDVVPEAAEKLVKTMRYLDQGIEFKRRVVNDLHPSLLSTFGLLPALHELINSYADRHGWKMQVTLPEQTLALSEGVGLIAYRIVQETLNNAAKYAEATQVTVSFVIDESYVRLEIVDNGKGMDATQAHNSRRGLDGMRHRVVAVGGTFNIETQPGKGMVTMALIPLDTLYEDTLQIKLAE